MGVSVHPLDCHGSGLPLGRILPKAASLLAYRPIVRSCYLLHWMHLYSSPPYYGKYQLGKYSTDCFSVWQRLPLYCLPPQWLFPGYSNQLPSPSIVDKFNQNFSLIDWLCQTVPFTALKWNSDTFLLGSDLSGKRLIHDKKKANIITTWTLISSTISPELQLPNIFLYFQFSFRTLSELWFIKCWHNYFMQTDIFKLAAVTNLFLVTDRKEEISFRSFSCFFSSSLSCCRDKVEDSPYLRCSKLILLSQNMRGIS